MSRRSFFSFCAEVWSFMHNAAVQEVKRVTFFRFPGGSEHTCGPNRCFWRENLSWHVSWTSWSRTFVATHHEMKLRSVWSFVQWRVIYFENLRRNLKSLFSTADHTFAFSVMSKKRQRLVELRIFSAKVWRETTLTCVRRCEDRNSPEVQQSPQLNFVIF